MRSQEAFCSNLDGLQRKTTMVEATDGSVEALDGALVEAPVKDAGKLGLDDL